jgi:hypothetical protein
MVHGACDETVSHVKKSAFVQNVYSVAILPEKSKSGKRLCPVAAVLSPHPFMQFKKILW